MKRITISAYRVSLLCGHVLTSLKFTQNTRERTSCVPILFMQVERRHLEAAVDESIKTLDIAGTDAGPPATSDDLQVKTIE